ncbi:MAG: hypothetical protein GY937_22050 [bacterium]|nr:hypothetical protein [bacterium]
MGPVGALLVIAALVLAGILLGPFAARRGNQRRLWFMLALAGCFVLAGPATSALGLPASAPGLVRIAVNLCVIVLCIRLLRESIPGTGDPDA